MNRTIRKITLFLCTVSLAAGLAACGAGTAQSAAQEETTQIDTQTKPAVTQAQTTEAEPETLPETGPEDVPAGATPLHLISEYHRVLNYAEGEGYLKYRVENTDVLLSKDEAAEYPELAAALTERAEAQTKQLDETCAIMEEFSASFFEYNTAAKENGDGGLFSANTPYVLRADSGILSILYYDDSFTGGAHPNRAYDSATYQTSTGKKLALTDVVKDLDALASKVDEKLKEKYPEEYPNFYTDPLQAVKDSAVQDGIMAWTMGYEGMTVYFSPYSLGAYAMGEQILTIYYDEAPELFAEEFTGSAESYIIPLFDMVPVETDAAGNGIREEIWVETISTDEYDGCDFVVHRGGGQYRLNTYGYREKSYLVKENGQYYVYVFITTDNDYVLLYTVDLRTLSTPVKESMSADIASLGYSWSDREAVNIFDLREELLTDPAAFRLDSHMDFLSTMSGNRLYHTGPDGYPVADEAAYTVRNTRVLKVLQPVTVETVAEDGTVTGSAELTAGTYLFFIRTDNEAFMDMQAVDAALVTGEENEWYSDYRTEEIQEPDWSKPVYRIRVDSSDWPRKINGIEEDQVFAGIMYAG